MQWAGGIAPDATIVYVYSTNVLTSAQYAIDQNIAPVVSMSYGGCEPAISASGDDHGRGTRRTRRRPRSRPDPRSAVRSSDHLSL